MTLRKLISIFVFLLLTLCVHAGARAFEVVSVPVDVDSIELLGAIDILSSEDGRVQLTTAAGSDGVVRRIEVQAVDTSLNPKFAIFALRNDSDVQIERLLVAPFFKLAGSGVISPDLGSARIRTVTPSQGFRPERTTSPEADVFAITIDPGATVTYVAELVTDDLPELQLWKADSYRDFVNSFTLFRGIVLGIAVLLAVFLSILFVVRGQGVFPTTAALAWAVLVYLIVDFGIISSLFDLGSYGTEVVRSASETFLASTIFIFLFVYLNLHRWHLRFVHLAAITFVVLLGLIVLTFIVPQFAATSARILLAMIAVFGLFLIILLALRGYDRAVLLVPTWVVFLVWLIFGFLVVTGRLDNGLATPAIEGGLVLIVMLIGFTVVQHAFADGHVSLGTLSEVERKALALSGSGDHYWDWNVDRDRVVVSDEIYPKLGLRRGELRGPVKLWLDQIHPDDQDYFRTALDTLVEQKRGQIDHDFRLGNVSASYRTFNLKVRPVVGSDGQVARCIGTITDVHEDRDSRERLLHDAVHDKMTGLPNMQLFNDRLDRALIVARESDDLKPSVLLLDIDRFGEVNENIGYAGSDALILAISRRLSRVLNPLDTLARLNRDQFAVILLSEKTPDKIASIAESMRKAIRKPLKFREREIYLSASVGITMYNSDITSASDVLKDAEIAMYNAKKNGGDRIEAYRSTVRSGTRSSRGLAIEVDLHRALERNELVVLYQPIIDISNSTIAGTEALLRWRHPERGMVGPSQFIPLAERSGLIGKLGRFVMENAALQAQDWYRKGLVLPGFFVSVNLSTRQLMNDDLLQDVRSSLELAEIAPSALKFEITESQIMDNPEFSAHMLRKLSEIGVRLALDDFGTGHSSLAYLHRFPFDTLKIASDFVHTSDNRITPTQLPILKSIMSLANELHMNVIAEGVENDKDLLLVRDLGCRYVQGYIFGEPNDPALLTRRMMQ